jgi:hypothetical protein
VPTAQHRLAGVRSLLNHRVRSLGHIGQLVLGEGDRAVIDRDQLLRHLMTPNLQRGAIHF